MVARSRCFEGQVGVDFFQYARSQRFSQRFSLFYSIFIYLLYSFCLWIIYSDQFYSQEKVLRETNTQPLEAFLVLFVLFDCLLSLQCDSRYLSLNRQPPSFLFLVSYMSPIFFFKLLIGKFLGCLLAKKVVCLSPIPAKK